MKYVLMMIALAAICLACEVPTPAAVPTSEKPAPAAVPTSEGAPGVMDSMSCVDVMRYFDSIRLRRDDIGLSTDMSADNVELWIDFALLMTRLHREVVNFEVARDRVEECDK